jgi:hypothetical protein
MSNVLIHETGQLLKSVGTAKYLDKDGNPIPGVTINPTPEQIEQYKYVPSAPEAKAQKIQEIINKTNVEMQQGYPYTKNSETHQIDTSEKSISLWNNVINRCSIGNEPSFPYEISKTDGGVIEIADVEELKTLFVQASEYIENIHKNSIAKRKEVLAMSNDNVEAILNYTV